MNGAPVGDADVTGSGPGAGADLHVGGQAVVEGVMMRAGDGACVAVRRPDGLIETRAIPSPGWAAATSSVPLVRGLAALGESLKIGVGALRWSEARSAPAVASGRAPAPAWLLMTVAVGAALAMVVVIPALVAGVFPAGSHRFEIAETSVRLLVAGGYVAAVARRDDVRRVFQYHGAEHLVVSGHEAGRVLTPAGLRGGSIRHPRCGTSFLIVISLVAAAVHPLLPAEPLADRLVARVIVVPVVVALAFELLRWLARVAVTNPGGRVERVLLWPQRFTTREPDDAQVEVAVAALRGALDANNAPARPGAMVTAS